MTIEENLIEIYKTHQANPDTVLHFVVGELINIVAEQQRKIDYLESVLKID
jgi:hypothetical protein